ncbi:hypothetical protein HDU98_000501 [Podochytrium sp. JEL0797]|nr:hypothetical protein HDU98_000501 [Podochytrium sp. JEL0797]
MALLLLSASIAVSLASLYYLIVPHDKENLHGLLSVTDSAGLDLLNLFYPRGDNHEMVKLSQGRTHYFLRGPVDGRRIVMVHGINVTGNVFPQFIDELVRQGYRVLSYDLYGMGYSSAPGLKYDSATYTTQLKDLLDHVQWEKPLLLGFSLGGGIATEFALKFPESVDKLVLVAPAGLKHRLPVVSKLFVVPFLGEILFYLLGRRFLSERGKKHLTGYIPEPYKVCNCGGCNFCSVHVIDRPLEYPQTHFIATQNLNFKLNPGFARCYFKTIQNGPIQNRDAVFVKVGTAFGNRVMCVWGREDTTCDFEVEGQRFQECMPDARFVALDGRHTIMGEKPKEVVDAISAFVAC